VKIPKTGPTFWLILLIVCLSTIGSLRHPWISYRQCLADPARYRGRVIEGFREPIIGPLAAGGFTLLQKGEKPVFVHTDAACLRTGEYVGLRAVLLEDGSLRAVAVVMAERRREKMALSLIPAVLGIILLLARFRFKPRGMTFERRRRA
jgi:hypothetical protein